LGKIWPGLETYAEAILEGLVYEPLAMVTDDIHVLFYNPAINLKFFN
jgi:hypothetical protein